MVIFLLSDGKSRGFHIDPSLLQKMQRGMLLKGTEGEHRDEERFQKTSETCVHRFRAICDLVFRGLVTFAQKLNVIN